MSDSIIIQAVYISLGPFFNIDFGVDPKSSKEKTPFAVAALGGSAALRALRLSSLSLIRSVGFLHLLSLETPQTSAFLLDLRILS